MIDALLILAPSPLSLFFAAFLPFSALCCYPIAALLLACTAGGGGGYTTSFILQLGFSVPFMFPTTIHRSIFKFEITAIFPAQNR